MNPYIELPKVPLLHSRQNIILEKCRDKHVLHLGCVDSGLLKERFATGELMHQKLATVTRELWGFDIDKEGIEFLKSRGFQNLYSGDAGDINDTKSLQGIKFDVIVASEVVEHLQNPGLFFQVVRSLMIPQKTIFIITVPNAFRIDTLIQLTRGVEFVHPDHNYWFSYHTITNLLRKNGFTIQNIYVYAFNTTHIFPRFVHKIFNSNAENLTTNQPIEVNRTLNDTKRLAIFNRIWNYFVSVPRRLLNTYLFSKTSFWGDGIIVETTLR